jgi:release factor glutamine methyltransferase
MNSMTTIAEGLSAAARQLSAHSDSPRLDAELLLGKILGLARSGLIANEDRPLVDVEQRAYTGLIARRLQGQPVAYLTGDREFWSLPFKVTPAVLVPRPETELLVERALELMSTLESVSTFESIPLMSPRSVLDLGTGSGAIALAIASERPNWQVIGVDVSPQALDVARQNARALNISRVEWRLASWFEAVHGQRFELIVSNPPYVAAADPALAKLSAEPALALSPGATGLEALTAIIAQAPEFLQPGGWLVLEHGHDQGAAVTGLLQARGFSAVRTYPDFSGNSRVSLGTFTHNKELP